MNTDMKRVKADVEQAIRLFEAYETGLEKTELTTVQSALDILMHAVDEEIAEQAEEIRILIVAYMPSSCSLKIEHLRERQDIVRLLRQLACDLEESQVSQ